MSCHHGRVCKGSASCFRPRIKRGHHGAVLYDRLPLLPLPFLFHSTSHREDADEGISSLLSAICFRTHAFHCSSGRCDAVLHAPHNSIRPSASGSRDDGRVSLVSLALPTPPFYVAWWSERIGKPATTGIKKRGISASFLFRHLNIITLFFHNPLTNN